MVYLHPGTKSSKIEPDKLKELADKFRMTVINELKTVYPIVDHPAADVMRIRAAITDVKTVTPAANIAHPQL